MTIYYPIAGFLTLSIAVALYFILYWEKGTALLASKSKRFRNESELAGIKFNPQEIAITIISLGAVSWLIVVVWQHPPIIVDIILFPALIAASFFGVQLYIKFRLQKRRATFLDQLEALFRAISGAMRSGLGLQQALVTVVGELDSPAREEVSRVIGKVSIGVSIFDAFDEMAERMPSNEMVIASKTIRAQSQTGGDLSKILERLANTIRERRRLFLKINAITSEGRASAWVVGLIPFGLALVLIVLQHDTARVLFHTSFGLLCFISMAALDLASGIIITKMLKLTF